MDIISYSQAIKAKREWQKVEKRIGPAIIGSHSNAHVRINAIQSQANNLAQGVLSEITERNMIQQLKRTLRLESLQASTQHKMHQMIIEYLSDDSSFDLTKSSNATFGVNKVEPTNRNSNFTVVTEAEEVGTVTSFMFSGGLRGTAYSRVLDIKDVSSGALVGIKKEGTNFVAIDGASDQYIELNPLYLGENFASLEQITYTSPIQSIQIYNGSSWVTITTGEIINLTDHMMRLRITPLFTDGKVTISSLQLKVGITLKEAATTSSITLSQGELMNTEIVSGRVQLKKNEEKSTASQVIFHDKGYWRSPIIDREVLGIHKYLESLTINSTTTFGKKVLLRESDDRVGITEEVFYPIDSLLMTKQKHKRFYQIHIQIEAGMEQIKSQFASYVDELHNTELDKNSINTKIQYANTTEATTYVDAEDEPLCKLSNYKQNWLRIDKVR